MKTTAVKVCARPSGLWLGVALGLAGGLALGRRLAGPPRATRLDLWQRLLARRRGAVEAALVAAQVQARFEELYRVRPRFAHPALRNHLDHNILPGLALYQVLRQRHGEAPAALAEWDEVVGAREGSPSQRSVRLLDRLPGSFTLFRTATRGMMRLAFPPEGWTITWVEDSDRRIAFNIEHCFYLTVLSFYGAPELTEHFCRLDDLMAEALPPSIQWARSMTLGRGGPRCDFCWSQVSSKDEPVYEMT